MISTSLRVRWSCTLLAFSSTACSIKPGADTKPEDPKTMFASIKNADQVILYEGLPHQGWEPTQFKEELRTKQTVKLQDYPFYRAPLEISADEQKKLKEFFSDKGAFRQWNPPEGTFRAKGCGAFHPDYAIEWRVGEAKYQMLICYGCEEIRVYGSEKQEEFDITVPEQLKKLLDKHQKNRPAIKKG